MGKKFYFAAILCAFIMTGCTNSKKTNNADSMSADTTQGSRQWYLQPQEAEYFHRPYFPLQLEKQ